MWYDLNMQLTLTDLGLGEDHTIWFHNEQLFVADEVPDGSRVLVVRYTEDQPDLSEPMYDQMMAHFRSAGMGFICEQGVIQVAGTFYPYAVFC